MRSLGLIVTLILGFAGIASAQLVYSSELRTFTLTSPYAEDGHGKLKHSEKVDRNCFDLVSESEVRCRSRWDLVYGNMRAGEEWDWFLIPGSAGVRSRMVSLGKKDWNDEINLRVIQPFPELKPGESYKVSIDASGRDGAPGKPGTNGDGTIAESRNPAEDIDDARVEKAPVSTSGHVVKAVKGNMYLVRVKDAENDFYVLLRVDDIVRGRNATISWRRVEAPTDKQWKQL